MRYVRFFEQLGMEIGIHQGKREIYPKAIRLGLELKFGDAGLQLMPEIERITDVAVLEAIHEAIKPARSLDDIRHASQSKGNGASP